MNQESYVRFSERYGYVHREIQIESIDEALWSGLWNAFLAILDKQSISREVELCQDIWEYFFKGHKDEFDNYKEFTGFNSRSFKSNIKEILQQDCWYVMYDFIEYVGSNAGSISDNRCFIETCNLHLEREKSAYSFVNGLITPIISDIEIEAIESADKIGGPVAIQLRSALEKLSDRQTPDYRNSIKESISAVESQARRVMRSDATLGRLLNKMEEERGLPTPLKTAFSTFYGYASGRSGARHGPPEAEGMEVDFDLAKFMLVTCSAFANYLATLEEPHEGRMRPRAT